VGQVSTCSLWRTPCQSRWMPEGGYDPVGSPVLEQAAGRTCGPMERGAHAGAGLLAGLVTPWGPMLEQPVPEGLHPVGRTHAFRIRLSFRLAKSTKFLIVVMHKHYNNFFKRSHYDTYSSPI